MHISELDTPAIVIDLDIMERNLRRMAEYTKLHGLRLRPHTKTHKIPALGARQLALGAVGLTVAKVSEAEVMLESGVEELLIAYPVIGAAKLARVVEVAKKTRLTISVDSLEAAEGIAAAAAKAGVKVHLLVEMDVGLGRVGVKPGADALALAAAIDKMDGVDLEGLAFYPGHLKDWSADAKAKLAAMSETVSSTIDLLKVAGLEVRVVSGGSTPTEWHAHEVHGMNEVRPGTYIFNDRNTILCGACTLDDCAATILATVVSTSVDGQLIIDGGSKTFSSDKSAEPGHGIVMQAKDANFARMNEEHGYVELADARDQFKVGDRVNVLPNHICVAMNLHEQVYGVRGETVERMWPVAARGKLQ